MELENCINFLLSTAQHNVFQYLNSQLAEYGITPAQYGVMNCLWKYRELTPKQIGELLHLEASSVSGILERMQNNGLLERNVDPENRRMIRVSPTQKTLDLQSAIEKIILEMNERVLAPFTRQEQERIRQSLTVIGNLDLT
ncbi:MarR family winged helix-turn-helix transcriptional regulator [Intestinimonas massiliensis (ex Afouda et al. 2020)]|uniref:MarR family winged helix-turn-helix transcriptional regulator n=1 Tax=Intestinimonas massiliensis (ex Afouda et al. 2020) TaxID=1673721 RepID=UPI001030F2F3|nr:MarR family transcriptional regulator [Intestinimonas massiliensis (ex Afouda et al. 2020)]